jgi:hypothetical protein
MAGQILTDCNFQGISNDGLVTAYGKLYIVSTITGLPVSTFQDTSLSIVNTNPVILSSSGRARVFLSYGQYNITLKDQFDTVVWTLNGYVSSVLDNQSIIDAAASTAVNASSAQSAATIATTQANIAIQAGSSSASYALTCSSLANMIWASFNVVDGELNVSYVDGATSTPSLVDGEFIITY